MSYIKDNIEFRTLNEIAPPVGRSIIVDTIDDEKIEVKVRIVCGEILFYPCIFDGLMESFEIRGWAYFQ